MHTVAIIPLNQVKNEIATWWKQVAIVRGRAVDEIFAPQVYSVARRVSTHAVGTTKWSRQNVESRN
jgi:hypothetical protein